MDGLKTDNEQQRSELYNRRQHTFLETQHIKQRTGLKETDNYQVSSRFVDFMLNFQNEINGFLYSHTTRLPLLYGMGSPIV